MKWVFLLTFSVLSSLPDVLAGDSFHNPEGRYISRNCVSLQHQDFDYDAYFNAFLKALSDSIKQSDDDEIDIYNQFGFSNIMVNGTSKFVDFLLKGGKIMDVSNVMKVGKTCYEDDFLSPVVKYVSAHIVISVQLVFMETEFRVDENRFPATINITGIIEGDIGINVEKMKIDLEKFQATGGGATWFNQKAPIPQDKVISIATQNLYETLDLIVIYERNFDNAFNATGMFEEPEINQGVAIWPFVPFVAVATALAMFIV